MKEWDAYNELKQKIDDFNECCPLLEMMANKAMKQRHWDRIENLTQHHFDIHGENFCLRNIMEAPLLKNKEDIEVNSSLLLYTHKRNYTLGHKNSHTYTIVCIPLSAEGGGGGVEPTKFSKRGA